MALIGGGERQAFVVGGQSSPFRLLALGLAWGLATAPCLKGLGAETKTGPEIFVPASHITIYGNIDEGLASSVKRRTDAAVKDGAKIIFYEIDTWGGLVDPALEIADVILGVKDAKTVAYIPPRKKAISAGALIALSCNEIVMSNDTYLGDCEPIIPTGEAGMTTAPEKVQTVLRARFRAFAERNKYPVVLAEAMVSKDTEVYRVELTTGETKYVTGTEMANMSDGEKKGIVEKKVIVAKDRLLTMTQTEAVEYGFAKKVVSGVDELYALYHVKSSEVIRQETNWSEEMVRALDSISPILMLIGFLGIYLEFKYPGTFIFAGIAVVCFGLVFLSKYMVGLAEKMAILVFIIGFALILLEVFLLPGYLIPGFVGVTLLLAGLILASQPFVVPETPFETEMLVRNVMWVLGALGASVFLFVVVVQFLPHTPVQAWTILTATEQHGAGYSVARDREKQLLGKSGISVSLLRPAGRAEIEGSVVDVVTEGEFIERGKAVRVKQVDGNRIVVEGV